jgi:hypothetical protein
MSTTEISAEELEAVGELPLLNMTQVPTADIVAAMEAQANDIFQKLTPWAQALRADSSESRSARNGGLLARDRYLSPVSMVEQMRVAYAAVEQDDIVGGAADMTESLAFSEVSMFSPDPDEQDVYNQIAANLDLDSRLREMWRELYSVSQFYFAVWWDRGVFRVRGKTEGGRAKRKSMVLEYPRAISLIDPYKVVPVKVGMFNEHRLAYCATKQEAKDFRDIFNDDHTAQDELVMRLVEGPYTPDKEEKKEIRKLGYDPSDMFLFKKDSVFRHTLTKPTFMRMASIRIRSIFELLDLKQQLRQMERAHLIGGINFIVLIRKGSDLIPGMPQEIASLQSSVRVLSRTPVIVGDHRLSVDIVTPKLDMTLQPNRHNTLDARITARIFGILFLGNFSSGAAGDDSAKLVKVIAKGMESKRHMLRRTLESAIWRPMLEKNPQLQFMAKMRFHPRSIMLDFDSAWASFLLDLRENFEISRDTILSQFDLSQEEEAMMRQREAEQYDDIFQTQVGRGGGTKSVGAPDDDEGDDGGDDPPPRDNGGGRRNGGGGDPGSGQGQPPRRVRRRKDGPPKEDS